MNKKILICVFIGWLMVGFAQTNLNNQASSFSTELNQGTASEYIEITQKRLLTVIVTNRISVKPPYQSFYATIINQVPRPVCWRDGKTYEGLTNLIFFPTSPNGSWLKPAQQIWQCEPRFLYQWDWKIRGNLGQEVITTSKYQIVTARRRLRTEKLHMSLADLKELPPDLLTATSQVKASLPSNVTGLARTLVGNEEDVVKIVKRFSDWVGHNVVWNANDLSGKYITRYNLQIVMSEKRGWCGPQSTGFRALCIAYGIPAREVSGYYLKSLTNLNGGEINKYGNAEGRANDSNAHVWAEVFLPHVGWVEIAVGYNNPFAVPANCVPVYGIEAPSIGVKNEEGKGMPSESSQNISVTSEEIL